MKRNRSFGRYVHGRVQKRTDGTTDRAGKNVVEHLGALVVGLGQQLAHLEDAAKVTGVPQDVAPQGALQALVHGQ